MNFDLIWQYSGDLLDYPSVVVLPPVPEGPLVMIVVSHWPDLKLCRSEGIPDAMPALPEYTVSLSSFILASPENRI